MLAVFIPQIASFIMLPIFSRYLRPEDYGIVSLVNGLSVFLPLVFSLQLQKSIGRFYFIFNEAELKRYISSVYLLILFIAIIVLCILEFFASDVIKFIYPNVELKYVLLFQISFVTGFFTTINSISLALLRVREKARMVMSIALVSMIVSITISVIEIVVLKRGAHGVIEAAFLSSIVICLMNLAPNLKFIRPRIDLAIMKEPISFSLPVIPHAMSGLIFMYSDRIILEKFVPLSMIGLYYFANRIAEVFKKIVNQFNNAYQPNFFKTATESRLHAEEEAQYISSRVMYGVCALVVLASLFSVEALDILIDHKYFETWWLIPILSASYIFRCAYVFNSGGIFFEKKTGVIAMITVVAGTLNIVLNLIFIPVFGIIAAALSTLLSFLITFLLAEILSRRYWFFKHCSTTYFFIAFYNLCSLIILILDQ